jgi:hypothetical protein
MKRLSPKAVLIVSAMREVEMGEEFSPEIQFLHENYHSLGRIQVNVILI